MLKILASYICFLQDRRKLHNVREIHILENRTVHYRSNDVDGTERRYTKPIEEFESEFQVSLPKP